MLEELNAQFMEELASAYLYLSMSAYFEAENYKGFANWMRVQANEEFEHAMKFYDYIFSRGGKVSMKGLSEPKAEWESPLAAFKAALEHEQYISDRINKLMDLAIEEKDHATRDFLDWFVNEQVEEENNVMDIVGMMEKIGDSEQGLFFLDQKLGERTDAPEDEE